jgi:hypothetical protein
MEEEDEEQEVPTQVKMRSLWCDGRKGESNGGESTASSMRPNVAMLDSWRRCMVCGNQLPMYLNVGQSWAVILNLIFIYV